MGCQDQVNVIGNASGVDKLGDTNPGLGLTPRPRGQSPEGDPPSYRGPGVRARRATHPSLG